MKNALFKDLNLSNISASADLLNASFTSDLVDLIEERPLEEQLSIFNTLSQEKAASVFEYLSLRTQKDILQALDPKRIATLLDQISPDDRTALLETLGEAHVKQLLKYLSPKERTIATQLLGYKEDSVGRLMTPDFIAIKMDWTVQQVLDYVRAYGADRETINVIYAVDDQGKLIDDFRLRQFLFAPLTTKVEELSDHKYIALDVNDSEESALVVFRKYTRNALPVIDQERTMLGIVTLDDIMHLAVAKDTAEMQKIGGTLALKEPYMKIPFFALIRKRVGWLSLLFLGELLTASAMGYFQDEIARAIVLTLFVPLIISSGGNAGSQASTLIIRALALHEISWNDGWKIIRREFFSGLFLGSCLGAIGFIRIALWGLFLHMYGVHYLLVASTVFLSLIGVVLWGTLAGAALPLLLKRCGFDPAVSSAPFVATLIDVTGLIIYFGLAVVLLQGTLL